jgi:hypothetical protein
MTEELRQVRSEDTCFFEPGCRCVTKIAKLESLEARGLARASAHNPNTRPCVWAHLGFSFDRLMEHVIDQRRGE